MRLAQRRFLPHSEHWHLAEVFFSGLLQRSILGPAAAAVSETWYEFLPRIRELLLQNSPVQRTAEIWREIGDFITHNYGSLRDFPALIPNQAGSIQDAPDSKFYFAEVEAAVLMTWGGEYARRGQQLSAEVAARKQEKVLKGESPPGLQPFEFEVALIEVNESVLSKMVDEEVFSKTGKNLNDLEQLVVQGTLANQTYEQIAASAAYSVVSLKNVGIKLWKILSEVFGEKVTKKNLQSVLEQWSGRRRLTIHRRRQQNQYFIEDLGNGVPLEMVQIPAGNFIMGAPKNEKDSRDSERPQHQVTISPFFLGKYPVTQAQWQAVAALPQVNRELNPDPSRFKGEKRPVEQVSWYDVVEFCDRLSRATGKPYRLPSEAEWEYACRAGTTTPFHFGETITSELANYNGEVTYGAEPKGTYRGKTTEVGSFGVANAFGLYDMHGNVWEWCADHWHDDYEGAPRDGSAWLIDNDNQMRLLRGGSWYDSPEYCRSADRIRSAPDYDNVLIGFRVVCVPPSRILSA
ncbi:MAG: formylglycine-generating enzyme family protein [Stigonema ocellatum SAG 48.90 = DSM 106950]|nr:formylglycine-generating enzyme family protein [Stigonema ocellatum SAG 48.90 = DSM 106950]